MPSNKFCTQCGAATDQRIPADDNRVRDICTQCEFIAYENPKIIVGCLLHWQGKFLLCKRAIEPRYGYWTLPAGFMENKETTLEGAAREAQEEACAESDNLRLFAVYNLPRISQVYFMYTGELKNGFAQAGEETLETGLYAPSEIPWKELAFPVVGETLKRYFDSPNGFHNADIHSQPGKPIEVIDHAL